MGLNEFPPQPREGLMTKQPPCAPWPAASFNQGIWHLHKLLGYEEQRGKRKESGVWCEDLKEKEKSRRGEVFQTVVAVKKTQCPFHLQSS